jgi:hypothetical protein
MKAVEVAVRDAAHLPDGLLGVKLMREAFAPAPDAGPPAQAVEGRSSRSIARMAAWGANTLVGRIGVTEGPV